MRSILHLVLLTFFTFPLFCAPSLQDSLKGDRLLSDKLLNGEEVTLFHNEEFVPEMVPESLFSGMLLQRIEDLNPNMAIEGLYFLPMEDIDENDILNVVNTLCSISKLQGLNYYSASRGVMRLLFEESSRIDNPKDKNPLPDLQFDSLPSEVTMDIHQRDLTFYNSESSLRLYPMDEVVYMEQINHSPMRYNGLIRVIAPGNFQTRILVIPCEEGLLYYGIMAADTLNIKAFKERANQSFYNRMKALAGWFFSHFEQSL